MRKLTRAAFTAALAPMLIAASASMASAAAAPTDDSVEATVDAALAAVGQELTAAEAAAVPAEVSVSESSGVYRFAADTLEIAPVDADNSMVLAREDGIQALTVLDEGASTAEFELRTPEGTTVIGNDQGFDVVLEDEGFSLSIAQVAAPWAVDANGVSLPTSYAYDDGVITQHVDIDGAVFPVVADPLITFGLANAPQGPGPYLNLTGQVMNTILAGVIFAAQMSPAVICVTLDKIPHPVVRNIVRSLCGLFGVATVSQVMQQVQGALQGSSWRNGQCYQMRVPGPGPFVATSASNCA